MALPAVALIAGAVGCAAFESPLQAQTQTPARAAQRPAPAPAPDGAALRAAIAAAEDRRPEDDRGLASIREGLKAGDASLQVLAVRAMGRLERASLVPEIAPLLESTSPVVRMEAANALGQAVLRGEPATASAPLTARAHVETDVAVLGVLARTLGRLPYQQESEVREAERVLIEIATKVSASAESSAAASMGVAHGFDALARRAVKLGSLSADARARLRMLARYGLNEAASAASPATATSAPASEAARVRRLAVSALVTARESNLPLLREVMRDPDDQVRRLGVVWMGIADDMPLRDEALRQAFGDVSPMVRYEALRIHARTRTGPIDDCSLEQSALQDANAHVVLLAIDQLGRCADAQQAAQRLTAFLTSFFDPSSSPAAASGTPGAARQTRPAAAAASQSKEWHRPAHALVALARVAPDAAAPFIARAASHEIWQVRMYAARAAGVLKDRVTLDKLAADADDNVRHAAVETLQPLAGHDADAQYLAALDRGDYQLLRAAARALAGTTRKPEASAALLKAFVRISKDRRDTSRDARMALLETLDETGRAATATGTPNTSASAGTSSSTRPTTDADVVALQPYLADFDPVVAARVAMLLTAWTGQGHTANSVKTGGPAEGAAPRSASGGPASTAAPGVSSPGVAVPSPREIDRLARTRATVRMARGGTFTLALLPQVAPTNVARFVRLARAGYFNGLTLHRVEPNFVVQGGSPGANEYAGDAAYTRDELDLTSNERGTVGISTRGRDTGDGQIYINLVDNARLDHNYTVIAEVVEGLPVVDTILEGDVITRIELRERP
jgi:cyclophilin family peptidyl-prolyl cis-trans isomerase/HEAT repeat protein